MAHQYRIRVKPMVPWPGNHHAHIVPPPPPSNYADWAFVVGAPKSTLGRWWCDTDYVWPVLAYVTPDGDESEPANLLYVCRHQIQIGD